MASIDVRNAAGSSAGSVELSEDHFGIEPNVSVLHQVVTAQLAARRSGTQSTKTRSEVSGGGAKPFAQKGTGRARQGSSRAPAYTGGGVALGPKPRSYKQKVNKKMVALATRSALSDRAAADRVVVIDNWDFEQPSTKSAMSALSALGLEDNVLLVIGRDDENAQLSFRNLQNVQIVLPGELNAYDILCNDWIVFAESTLPGADELPAASAQDEASTTDSETDAP